MRSKVFLGNRKERLKLYKTKKGWVLAKKTAIVLGTTTAVGLSLAVNVSANNVDTPTSDSTVVTATNIDDKKEVTGKGEAPMPTTATSELSNTNKNTSDSTSNIANETSDATSDVVSETNTTSETVSASSNSATASDTNVSNQAIANTVPAKAKLATTSLITTSEPTTEAQPTLTTAQTDNTQVAPTTSWTSTNGDYHVELSRGQISAEDNGLEIKISGTSKGFTSRQTSNQARW